MIFFEKNDKDYEHMFIITTFVKKLKYASPKTM
jgi:hypothetical protein